MIPQPYAFVNTRGTAYQKELILLCVNYTSKRADYEMVFTEGSSLCVCVRVCRPPKGSTLNVKSDYLYYN